MLSAKLPASHLLYMEMEIMLHKNFAFVTFLVTFKCLYLPIYWACNQLNWSNYGTLHPNPFSIPLIQSTMNGETNR